MKYHVITKKTFFLLITLFGILVYFLLTSHKYTFPKINSFKDFFFSTSECPNTLVVFDIDETLITLPNKLDFSLPFRLRIIWNFPQLLYSSTWEYVYSKLWQQVQFILIEPEIVQHIQTLQSQGCIVLGLTSMESGTYGVIPSMPEWRFNTLSQFGIEFTQTFGNHTFTNLPQYRNTYPMLYKGILCTNQQQKGHVLAAFLTYYNLHPEKIIFFDDDPKHLQSVQETGKKLNIPTKCYQYTSAQKFDALDPEHVLQQIRIILESKNLEQCGF